MKIRAPSSQRRQSGVAIVVILAMLSIMLVYVTANLRSLHHLGRELKLLEQRQIQRLNSRSLATNTVPQATTSKPEGEKPAR